MLQENLIKMYEASFRKHHALTALTDYFSKDSKTYFEMAEQIARMHVLFDKLGLKQGDKVGAEIVDEYIDYLASGVTTIINNHSRYRDCTYPSGFQPSRC